MTRRAIEVRTTHLWRSAPAAKRSVLIASHWFVGIYDDVPGGAGHTPYIEQRLVELVTAAVTRLKDCSCGEETSCYGCLRNYRNQNQA